LPQKINTKQSALRAPKCYLKFSSYITENTFTFSARISKPAPWYYVRSGHSAGRPYRYHRLPSSRGISKSGLQTVLK